MITLFRFFFLRSSFFAIRSSFFLFPSSLFVCAILLWVSSCTELTQDRSQHTEGWADTSSVNFHGTKVIYSGISSCASCHGEDYRGGSSGVSCSDCHQAGPSGHPEGFIHPDSSIFHGYIFWDNEWNFSSCQECHGDNFEGGVVEFGCSQSWCHASEGGVEACDNCHSDGTEIVFEDVRNHTSTDSITVGAHTSHIKAKHSLAQPIDCSECHIVPDSLFSDGHLDTTQKVTFGLLTTQNGTVQSVWNRNTATCSEVYCHQSATSKWTQVDGTYSSCGSCHNLPPNKGAHDTHVVRLGLDCSACHTGYSSTGEMVMISTHINGKNDIEIDTEIGGTFSLDSESCSGVRCHGVLNTTPMWYDSTDFTCSGCHGGLNDQTGAPPTDLNGNVDATFLGVGAHGVHLSGSEFSDGVDCSECHIIPDSLLSSGHFDIDLIAEINWGSLATDSNFVQPVWDRETASCSQTYCHGNFVDETSIGTISGNDSTFVWTNVESEEYGCGSCHGIPPDGHTDFLINCSVCHSSVVDQDTTITEEGKAKHINGEIDYP